MAAREAPASRLHGRDKELGQLMAALDRAHAGALEVVMIEADSGMGKSRLLREVMLAAAGRGFGVLHAECEAERQGEPFAGLITAFGAFASSSDATRRSLAFRLAGKLAGTGPEGRFRAVDAVLAFLEELVGRGPILLAIDDVNYADSGTRLVLRQLVLALADRRLMVALAMRPGASSVEALAGPVAHLRLRRLDRAAVAALATDVLGARPDQRLMRELEVCGGIPLLVLELLRQLQWENAITRDSGGLAILRPDSASLVGEVLSRRLDSLPSATADVVSLAAVLGRTFSIAELAALAGRPAQQLLAEVRAAIATSLLVERGASLAFSHPLIQEAALARLPASVRIEMHRAAAEALEKSGAPPGQIARHLAESAVAGDPRAAEWFAAAARDVIGRAPDEASDFYQRAAALLSPSDPLQGEISAGLAEALSWSGRLTDAVTAAGRALQAGLDNKSEQQLRVHLARSLRWQGRPADAYQQATSGTIISRELKAEAALAAVFSRRVDHGKHLADEVLKAGENDLAACIAFSALCFGCFASCHWAEALEAGQCAVRLAETDATFMTLAQPRLYYGHACTVTGNLDDAEWQLQSGLREAEGEGRRWQEPLYHQYLARKRWLTGDWDDALAEDEAAALAAADIAQGSSMLMAGPVQVLSIRLHRGELRDLSAVAGLTSNSTPESPTGGTLTDWQLALVLESLGRPAQALDVLIAFWRRCSDGGLLVELRQAGADVIRIADAAGRRTEVEFTLPLLEEIRRRANHPLGEAAYLHAAGLWEGSFETCLRAVELLRTANRPLEFGTACESAFGLALRAGRREEAIAVALEAADAYTALGASFDLARVRARLREAGHRHAGGGPRRRARSGWESLTPSELRVAVLVTEGLSNPQVAERLFVSRRTVETHLKHIYAKLDLVSRLQLATVAARHL